MKFIYKNPKLEPTKIAISKGMEKQIIQNRITHSNKNKRTTDTYNIHGSQKKIKERSHEQNNILSTIHMQFKIRKMLFSIRQR